MNPLRSLARRLLAPDLDAQQETVRDTVRDVARLRTEAAARDARWLAESHATGERIAGQTKAASALRRRVDQLLARVKEQERLVSLLAARSSELEEHATAHRRMTKRAAVLSGSDRPIVVGPWRGEVGFELLYWIPFLTWLAERRGLDRRRLLVVTRGGAGGWYRHLAEHGAEILDFVTAEDFRQHPDTLKQSRLSTFDRDLLRAVIHARGLPRPHLLHPLVMYRLFIPYWRGQPVLEPITSFMVTRPLPAPDDHPALDGLPDAYVAVKFYFSRAFPDTPDNRAFIQRVIDTLSEAQPVVVLRSGSRLDDHDDAVVPRGARVHVLQPEARDNLAAQSAVVARARAFVGTYGGFSYLAPLYGVNALSFFSARDQLIPFHLEHAQRAFGGMGGGRFVALDVADAGVVASGLGALAAGRPERVAP